jgi:parallel beta-helix repeat protein
MRKEWLMKFLALCVIVLFIGVSFQPVYAVDNVKKSSMHVSNANNRTIIRVDDEGDGDYTSIKEAVNNANPGDTIEVYSGTYYEHDILIEKDDITLKGISYELGNGSDTGKPFIDGQGIHETIVIKARNIVIDSFRMENKGPNSYGILALYNESDACVISNNNLSNSTSALIWCDGSNTTIINNNINHVLIRQGIVLCEPGHHNTVNRNIISDCDTGICVWDSNNNTITGNKIMRCSDFGIDVAGSYNKIIGNHLEDNNIGIQIWNFFNSVKRNNFINNDLHAQFIYGIPLLQRFTNIWFGNYWDKPRLLPYPILGVLVLLPIIQFDWRPVLKPYNISGMT